MCYANGSSKWHTPAYYILSLFQTLIGDELARRTYGTVVQWLGYLPLKEENTGSKPCSVTKSDYAHYIHDRVPKPVHTDG